MKRAITGQKRYRHAFTLIELVIVLGIISLVLVVTVPRLGGIYDRVLVEEQTRSVEQTCCGFVAKHGAPVQRLCFGVTVQMVIR